MTTTRGPESTIPWTVAIVGLMTASSLTGLLHPEVYAQETQNWTWQAQGQDLGNLLAALTLAASCWAYVRGSRPAGSVWLGTLFYSCYAFVVYAVAVHFNRLFLVYVAVLGLSVYAMLRHADLLRSTGPTAVGGVRTAGYTLVGTGVAFGLLWLGEIVPALLSGRPPESLAEAGLVANPIHVIDLSVVLPGFVLTGLSLLRGRPSGRFLAGPWLVFSALMGTSIVAAMVLMAGHGERGVLPPLVGVGTLVLVTLYAAAGHLRAATPGPPATPRAMAGSRLD